MMTCNAREKLKKEECSAKNKKTNRWKRFLNKQTHMYVKEAFCRLNFVGFLLARDKGLYVIFLAWQFSLLLAYKV